MNTIGSITSDSKYLSPLYQGTKGAMRHYINFVFGVEQSEKFSEELHNAIRGTKDSTGKYVNGKGFNGFWGSVGDAWEKSKDVTQEVVNGEIKNKSLWKVITESFKKVPGEFKEATSAAKVLSETSKWAATKSILGDTGKILFKRMPLIGNILCVAQEIPNIYRAFTSPQGGLGTGVKEIVRTGLKLAGFAAGTAIGGLLGPVGAIGGGILGGIITDKLVGKSFSDKLDEAKEKQHQEIPQQEEIRQAVPKNIQYAQNAPVKGQNQYAINPFMQSPYAQNPFGAPQAPMMPGAMAMNSQYGMYDYRDKDLMAMSAGLA